MYPKILEPEPGIIKEAFIVRVPSDVKVQLCEEATRRNMSVNLFVNQVLESKIRGLKKKRASRACLEVEN